jgi:ATP-dependent RNA helicase DeaD
MPILSEALPEILADAMERRGFTELTAVQQAVLEAEAEARDLRISSQTGSGKTVALGLALARHLLEPGESDRAARPGPGPTVLVLVPTRELAMQVRDELRWLYAGIRGLRTEVITGGTSVGLERRALSARPQLVVGTPGRVLDHLRSGALDLAGVQHAVLDESDRMLDMGFREDLEAILEGMPAERRTHLMSATFPPAVRHLADRFQNDALHIEGTRLGAANADIEHVAYLVEERDTYAALVNLLLLNEGARCLVFVERRTDATRLAGRLADDGFGAQPFSGELAQAQRVRTLEAFRSGSLRTLVATDVAARGIDVPDIEMVIHVDLPENADTYVHRSGRTGRAGSTGRSLLMVPPRAKRYAARILGRIEAEWRPAPGATKVRKTLRKRFRKELLAKIEAAEPSQKQVDDAKLMLDGRDPAAVVATLLEIAEGRPTREPMEIHTTPEAVLAKSNAAPDTSQGFVRFEINWGERQGAAPNRLLAHVCRRGQIKSNIVGSIQIGDNASTFEIRAAAASRFEKLVRSPDSREPELRITRAGGGGGHRGHRPHGPGGNRPQGTARGRPHGKKPGVRRGQKPYPRNSG